MKRTLFFSACLTAISSIGLVSAVVQNRSIQEPPTLSTVADSTILPKKHLALKSDFVKFMDLFGPSVDHFDFTKEAALSNLFPKDSIVLGNKLDAAHIDTWRKNLTYEQETLLRKFVDYSNGYFSVIRRIPIKIYPVKLIQGDNHYAFLYREVNLYSENLHCRDYIVVFDQNGVFLKSSWLGSVSLYSFISYSINNNLIATIQEHEITSNVQPKRHSIFDQAYESSSAVEQITLGKFQTINLTEKEKVMYDDFFEGFPPIDSTGKLLDPHSLNHPENPLSKN